jgi:hypothetical protein
MLTITRDQAELGDVPFITFTVWMYRPNEPDATVCGFHTFPMQEAGREISQGQTPLHLPVAQAFEKAHSYAKSKGISAIWISDPNCLFDLEQPR